ncbi:MAG: class I SAM-dependent methyltransferase [bacterium]|nr:class I SAM-dependent methyltransferase [bacterium]
MAARSLSQYLSFDRVAGDYDATRFLPETVREAVVEQVFSTASLASKDWFVDAGVGTGRFALPIAHRGVNVLGVDVSRDMMLQLLRKSPPANLHLVQADLRSLPVRSQSVSAVLVAHVLHLIADWRRVLLECRRVLRRDGVLFLLYESGKRFPAREHYIHLAGERGLLRPTLGAQNADEALAFVREIGGAVTLIEHPSLQWQARRTHREVLQELEKRTYSQLWDVPDEAHRELMLQTLSYVREQFGSEDGVYATEASVNLYAVRF